jgi:hypothetical protein
MKAMLKTAVLFAIVAAVFSEDLRRRYLLWDVTYNFFHHTYEHTHISRFLHQHDWLHRAFALTKKMAEFNDEFAGGFKWTIVLPHAKYQNEDISSRRLFDLLGMSTVYENIAVIDADGFFRIKGEHVNTSVFLMPDRNSMDKDHETCPYDYKSRRDYGYYMYKSNSAKHNGGYGCSFGGREVTFGKHTCQNLETLYVEHADSANLALFVLDLAQNDGSESILLGGFNHVPPVIQNVTLYCTVCLNSIHCLLFLGSQERRCVP